jgi:hypothetical protein
VATFSATSRSKSAPYRGADHEVGFCADLLSREYNRSGNARQAKASQQKKMKAKSLSFSFLYFSESGLFKGLRPKKIKIFSFS